MGNIIFVLGFVVGSVLGSFVKAIADRSLGKKSFWGRSYCPKCRHKLAWYDLFPVVSYIYLRGKCRYCHKKIGIEYLVVEVMMGILVGFLFWQSFKNFQFSDFSFQSIFNFQFSVTLLDLLLKIFFITTLAVLFLTDLKKMFIPDRVVLPAIWIGLIFLSLITLYKIGYLYYYLSQSPVGRLLLPLHSEYFQRHAIILAQPLFYGILMGFLIGGFFLSLIIVTSGKGMGGGDVKLGAFMGLVLGFPQAIFAVVLSFLIGAIFAVALIISGKKHFGQTIPFGPFLVLGSLIMLFWGNQIVDWYLHIGI
ncbi:MAG: hypothetical protein ACD_19C00380G0002 [uncultured bacterium]|nr:MAG: hypothetical protein ACD_19C00380G0002 [uncultured bacterium]